MKRLYIALFALMALCGCKEEVKEAVSIDTMPAIYPDYTEVTIPCNIAPMNFQPKSMKGVEKVDLVVTGSKEGSVHLQSDRVMEFGMGQWHDLLSDNVGGRLTMELSVKKGGKWYSYKPFNMYVSADSIDYAIVYRRLSYGYEAVGDIGLYERRLDNFDERSFINSVNAAGCMNCHVSNRCNPDESMWHFRSSTQLGATILNTNGKTDLLATKTSETNGGFVYGYWHPSGRYIAYALTGPKLFVPLCNEPVDEYDDHADIVIYDVKTNEIIKDERFCTKDFFNAPSFSPDGKTMYFLRADSVYMPYMYTELDYNLLSVDFDAKTGKLGTKVDTLFTPSKWGKSVSFPMPSYDGKYIMFSLTSCGLLSVYNKDTDLWLYDVKNRKVRPLTELNSKDSESYHNWSHDSKWVVFTSRRDDGYFARLYFSSMNEDGTMTKPFMLPQEDPWEYYTMLTSTYNVPEFVIKPVKFDSRVVVSRTFSKQRKQVQVRH